MDVDPQRRQYASMFLPMIPAGKVTVIPQKKTQITAPVFFSSRNKMKCSEVLLVTSAT